MTQVFSKEWFIKHQHKLLWFANSFVGKKILHIDSKEKIIKILPNSITWKGSKKNEFVTEFRTHDKYGKRLYYAFYPIWKLIHLWDAAWYPNFNLGFDSLTTYPSAGAVSPCDGTVSREGVQNSFADIVAATGGTHASTTGSTGVGCPSLVSDPSVNGQYQLLRRGIYNFTTSSLTTAATITSAVISVYGDASNTKADQLGQTTFEWCAATPAATDTIDTADYDNFGSTSFASISYASYTGSQYNDATLNASGIANISKTGISSFGTKLGWDLATTFGGAWSAAATTEFRANFADVAGTTNDPKLTVTYTLPSGGEFFYFM